MYKNIITAENTPDSHKEVIKGQINGQLAQASEDENLEAISKPFIYLDMLDDSCAVRTHEIIDKCFTKWRGKNSCINC